MNDMTPRTPKTAFASIGISTMADVIERAQAEMTGNKRRDTVSAFKTAARALGVDWQNVKATPPALRQVLNRYCAAELGLSDSRWRNVCSLVRKAFERFGEFQRCVTKRIPLADPWISLIARVPRDKQHWRYGLNRLACYCSALQLSPDAVDSKVLLGFYDALIEEELLKDPKAKLKHTIACWNMCHRNVADWPDLRLGSPFESTHYRLPASAFPETFQADMAAWRERCLNPDPLDDNAAPRALKAVTVDGQINTVLRFASALVIIGQLHADEITDFASLFEDIPRYKTGLRFFLDRNNGSVTSSTAQIAATLRAIAKYHVKVAPDIQAELDRLSAALRTDRLYTLTPKNRDRLKQFDDPTNVQKILAYPQAEVARARKLNQPHRRAKAMERAVATALLISTSLRAFNIRTLRISDFQWTDGHCYLSIPGGRVKNGMDLDFEIPGDDAALVTEYIQDFRPIFPGSESDYLFPGRNGGPRPSNSLFDNLKENIRKRTGLVMNPHLFRHFICKISVEDDPSMMLAVSRHMGHKRTNTTMQHYLGTEGRAVSRRIDAILKARAAAPCKKKKR